MIKVALFEEETFERDVNDEKKRAVQRSGGMAGGTARILWWILVVLVE